MRGESQGWGGGLWLGPNTAGAHPPDSPPAPAYGDWRVYCLPGLRLASGCPGGSLLPRDSQSPSSRISPAWAYSPSPVGLRPFLLS